MSSHHTQLFKDQMYPVTTKLLYSEAIILINNIILIKNRGILRANYSSNFVWLTNRKTGRLDVNKQISRQFFNKISLTDF